MKKAFTIIVFLALCSVMTGQISLTGRGSNMTGILGIEAQIGAFSIAESWRPLTQGESSYITTFSYYFRKDLSSGLIPYLSLSYSSKSFPYQKEVSIFYYDAVNIGFAPAFSVMAGCKSNIDNRLSGRGAFGLIASKYGNKLGFEVGLNVRLF